MKILLAFLLFIIAYFLYDNVFILLTQAGSKADGMVKTMAYCIIGFPIFMGIGLILGEMKRPSCLFFLQGAWVLLFIALGLGMYIAANKPQKSPEQPVPAAEAPK